MFGEKKTHSEQIPEVCLHFLGHILLHEGLMSENSRSAEGRSPGVEGKGDGTGARHYFCCSEDVSH